MGEQADTVAVRRAITVQAPVERAFAVFTDGMSTWWPQSHQVGPTPAEGVVEPFAGGRCYARAQDGTQTDWGRVLVWEPPRRLLLAWLLTPAWEYEPDPARASEVELRLHPNPDGSTRVELEHRGFERYADGGEDMRREVDSPGGWGLLLDLYAQALAPA